jgi:imidazole glycerol phosphate synthase subunit HisF
VHGLDLLAYRYTGDVPALIAAVSAAVAKPVIVAGSIDRAERVEAAATSGAQGFTVGTAALAGAFPAETEGFAGQVRAIMAITARAQAMSTAPRRIALVAHDTRKIPSQRLGHAPRRPLARHRIVCTGGTGRVLARRPRRSCRSTGCSAAGGAATSSLRR